MKRLAVGWAVAMVLAAASPSSAHPVPFSFLDLRVDGGRPATIDAVLGLTVLKVKFKSVTGYPGKSDVRLALLRNEVNLDSQARRGLVN